MIVAASVPIDSLAADLPATKKTVVSGNDSAIQSKDDYEIDILDDVAKDAEPEVAQPEAEEIS